jgi:hypothetical protein
MEKVISFLLLCVDLASSQGARVVAAGEILKAPAIAAVMVVMTPEQQM